MLKSCLALLGLVVLTACNDNDAVPTPPEAPLTWSFAVKSDSAALLGVHGTSERDVWMVGADDGQGPLLLHYDGSSWQRLATGVRGDLWWVNATPDGPVYFAGASGLLLRYQSGVLERIHTPALGKDVLYGVWAAGANDLYAVGTSAGRNGFVWHYDGTEFLPVSLPSALPEDENHDQPGLFKVWGDSSDSVWVSGGRGVLLHGNAQTGFTLARTGNDEILFTVNARAEHVIAVGGTSSGLLLDGRGTELRDRTPKDTPLLQGAWVDERDRAWAVGVGGTVLRADAQRVETLDIGLDFAPNDSLHSVWVDPTGGVWAVGGDVLTPNLAHGVAIHGGSAVPVFDLTAPTPAKPSCPAAQIDPAPEGSIARRWNEQILGAIRRDLPRPGVHARNLFHLSLAIWDGYSSYGGGTPVLTHEQVTADGADAARTESISYAAYRVLSHRYAKAVGGGSSLACFDAFMAKLGFDPARTELTGTSPRAVGNRIGRAVIEAFVGDQANEAADYADPDAFEPEAPNLVVDRPGCHAENPNLWQRLVLAKAETQNGIPTGAGAQGYIGAQWGLVTPFALERALPNEPYLDLGRPPTDLDEGLVEAAIDVLRKTSQLDVDDPTSIDVSPRSLGNNPLGTNDGHGRALNPITNQPYTEHLIRRSDFGRVLAEFWADGPTSETPPGHWNLIANQVSDRPELARRLFGQGPVLDRLAWDAHTYFVLNGSMHDAAIAAWELKRKYVTARPITLLRYMAEHGQRSDRSAPGYDPRGLPLIDGLAELITVQSSAPGQRHAHLARYVGEVAVRAWRGEPGDHLTDTAGVGWIRGVEWIPYQRRSFVTPAFPGYVSGHSTFSRAAATVLAGLTGSELFPGGFASVAFTPGYLFFERGPAAPVSLEWATYYDAADQAGQSRLWGGIHVSYDDLDGRRIGARVGQLALERARSIFGVDHIP